MNNKSMLIFRTSALSIAAGVSLLGAESAWSQAATPVASDREAAASSSAAAQNSQTTSGEIVVTAQKREERLRDVPMSITAATASQLRTAGVASVDDLGKIAPGFSFQKTVYGLPVYFIRGIGFYDTALGISPAVMIYTDQEPVPYAPMTKGVVLDLDRAEILKGPQGTLFGNNSTGGAINFIAAKPTDDFHLGGNFTAGRFGEFDGEGYISGPLTDTLKVRLAVREESRGDWQTGYTTNEQIGAKQFLNARLLVDWKPTDRLKFEFQATGWRDRSDVQQLQFVAYVPFKTAAQGGRPTTFPLASVLSAPDDDRAAAWTPGDNYKRDEGYYQFGLHADWAITDNITITSLTSVSKYDADIPTDLDATIYPVDYDNEYGHIRTISQELRAAGDLTNRAKFMIGANYESDEVYEHLFSNNADSGAELLGIQYNLFAYDNDQHIHTESVFGSLDYRLTDTLTAQGSVRYSDQQRNFWGCSRDGGDGGIAYAFSLLSSALTGTAQSPVPNGACITLADNFTPHPDPFFHNLDQSNVSYRLGLNWKFDRGSMVYANATKGYKAGSFPTNPAAFDTQQDAIGQESVMAYEIGAKSNFGGHAVELEGAAFYYDYRNKQIQGYKAVPPFSTFGALVSIPKSRIWGLEESLTLTPVRGLRFALAGTYLNTKVLQDPINPTGAFSDVGSFVGDAFPYTPHWQGNADLSYEAPVSDRLNGFAGAALTARTSTTTALDTGATAVAADEALLRLPGYTLLDLRFGVEARDNMWRLEVWGKNVTNKFYSTSATRFFDFVTRSTGMPVTYGATVTFKY